MTIYKIETNWNRYTVLADSFRAAYGKAVIINDKERDGLGKEDELPDIVSIIEGDEINEAE